MSIATGNKFHRVRSALVDDEMKYPTCGPSPQYWYDGGSLNRGQKSIVFRDARVPVIARVVCSALFKHAVLF